MVIALVSGLIYAGSARRSRRYRPGRPFEFAPVWFLSAPERAGGDGVRGSGVDTADPRQAVGGINRLAIGGERVRAAGGLAIGEGGSTAASDAPQETMGGASDRW